MSLLSALKSQVNNIRYFHTLFRPSSLLKNAFTLPIDFVSPSGWAAPPMVINILSASRCNLHCVFCSAEDMMSRRHREMTVPEIEHVVRQTLPFRPSFFLGGGEPFLRHDILDVIAAIKRHGLRLGIVTNGVLVTPERGAALKRLGVDSLMFSIHGTEEVHDRVVGAQGAFRKAMHHVEDFCRNKNGTNVMLNFVLQPENLDHVFDLVEIGRSVGVDHVRVEHLLFITPREMDIHRSAMTQRIPERLHPKMGVNTYHRDEAYPRGHADRLISLLREVRRRYGSFVFIKPWLGEDEIHEWYTEGYDSQRQCMFIWRSLFLDPAGNVIPCQSYSDMKLGNVLREPLLEIWNSRRYRELRRTIRARRLPGCARCCKA